VQFLRPRKQLSVPQGKFPDFAPGVAVDLNIQQKFIDVIWVKGRHCGSGLFGRICSGGIRGGTCSGRL
jgi:hypothetical protein